MTSRVSDFVCRAVFIRQHRCHIVTIVTLLEFENANGENKSVKDSTVINALQDQAQLALSKHISQVYPTQPSRFGKLLLMLPALRTINASSIEEIFFRNSIGSIPIERLLTDMYKSQDL